jgi:pyruvate dehydrogenase E1 component alpha subunit
VAESKLEAIEAEVNKMIDDAVEVAKNAPPPDLSLADKDVWADGGSAWRN